MKKFSLKTEADVMKKLSLYLSAHLSLSDSLRLLEDQANKRSEAQIFAAWRASIENGRTLSQAFSDSENDGVVGGAVSEISRYSAELGEKSGSLPQALQGAYIQIGKILALKKKIASALAYPMAILLGTVALVLGLMLFVFPKIIPLFKTLKVALPLSTRMLIGFSELLSSHWLTMLLVGSFVSAMMFFLFKYVPRVTECRDFVILRIPIVGHVVRAKIICGAFDSLSTLLQGGEQLSEALLSVSKTIPYREYRIAFEEASNCVVLGKSVADFFKEKKLLFPLYIFGIVSVGERTGVMESSIRDVADIAREELDDRLRFLTAALEPILMVAMSLVIGFIALSIILPIYGITSHFQNV
jgi:type IV pilus assembly protein PilC